MTSHAEKESSGAVFVLESSESEASTASSQCFKKLYLSLKEEPSAINILGNSLLILIVTAASSSFHICKATKISHPKTLMIIPYLSTLEDTFSAITVMTEIINKGPTRPVALHELGHLHAFYLQ